MSGHKEDGIKTSENEISLSDSLLPITIRRNAFLAQELQKRRVHFLSVSPCHIMGTIFDHDQLSAFDQLGSTLTRG